MSCVAMPAVRGECRGVALGRAARASRFGFVAHQGAVAAGALAVRRAFGALGVRRAFGALGVRRAFGALGVRRAFGALAVRPAFGA